MNINTPSDKEINERLIDIAGFCPGDEWAHVRSRLRRGEVFYVKRSPSGTITARLYKILEKPLA